MVICHFRISIVKFKEGWLLFFENSDRRFFLPLTPTGNYSLVEGRKSLDHNDRSKRRGVVFNK
jgi:hypothetical protein